jgi:cellobiose phosphorylase
LTPWSNDPVSDPNSEAFYIRDEDSGAFWSPTLLPTRGAGAYAHGTASATASSSTRRTASRRRFGSTSRSTPVKFSALTLRNRSAAAARLRSPATSTGCSATSAAKTLMHVVTELDAEAGAVFARNRYQTDFAGARRSSTSTS